jgi:hypothetical protein
MHFGRRGGRLAVALSLGRVAGGAALLRVLGVRLSGRRLVMVNVRFRFGRSVSGVPRAPHSLRRCRL